MVGWAMERNSYLRPRRVPFLDFPSTRRSLFETKVTFRRSGGSTIHGQARGLFYVRLNENRFDRFHRKTVRLQTVPRSTG